MEANLTQQADRRTADRVAVIYAAKSTEDVHGSIPTQLEDGRRLAADRGMTVVAEHQDEAKSAYHGDRGPGLATAMDTCERLAAEHGACALVVQHSDRLARGDARQARHLIEIVLWAIKRDVQLLSVQDPEMLAGGDMALLLGAIGGMRNNHDSARKAAATAAGMRRSAERGDASFLARGRQTGGYEVIREFDERGHVKHTAIKHPEDKWIYELIWELARAGRSVQAIQLELSSRGARTRPTCRDHKPRPWDVTRIRQVLDNPRYAGLVVHKGEVVGPGDWPAYVEPEEFYRLREERRHRAGVTARQPGRPRVGHLLDALAVCAACGSPMYGVRESRRKADGSARKRTYLCRAHRDHHPDSNEYCPAPPVDGTVVDQLVASGIDGLLADADEVRDQLNAGRRAEIERLGQEAASAREDAEKARRGAGKARERYERALAEGDDEAAEITLTAMRSLTRKAERADELANAALDAINASDEPEDTDVMGRLWEALSGRVADAHGDVRKLNAALREWFDRFEVERDDDDTIRVAPVLSANAWDRIMHASVSWPHGCWGRVGGYELEVRPTNAGMELVGVGEELQQRLDAGESIERILGDDTRLRLGVNNPSELRVEKRSYSQ